MRHTGQQRGAGRQQLAHLHRHGVEAPAQRHDLARAGLGQQRGRLALPQLGAGLLQARQRRDHASRQQQRQPHRHRQPRGQADEQHRQGPAVDALARQPHRQRAAASGQAGPEPVVARGVRGADQVPLGADASDQGLFQQVEEWGVPFGLADPGHLGLDAQGLAQAQLGFKRRACRRGQLGPGLGRQHHQAGQVVGRTARQRQHHQPDKSQHHQQLDGDEGRGQQHRVLPHQTGGRFHAPPPCGLNR